MKLINNTGKVFLAIAFLFFYSCEDNDVFLEDPDSIVIDNFFQTEDDFTRAMRGAYNAFKGLGYYGGSGSSGDIIITGDLLTDNLITNLEGRGSNRLSHNWIYDASNVPTSIYSSAYVIISRCNLILNRIDNLPDGEFKNQIRGEALALRAAAHLDVARFFSQIPTQSSAANSSIGIAYVTEFDPLAEPFRLESVSATYDSINKDLDDAIVLIGDAPETGRFGRDAVNALISRAALCQGDYGRVISSSASLVSSIQPAQAAELQSLWTSATSPGVIFEVPFIVSDPLLDSNYSQGTGSGMIAEYSVDLDFYQLFDQATEPERIQAYFLINNNWIVVNKYINGALQTGLNNGRYLRIEEVILNLAEAYYFNNNETQARNTLDILRSARYTSFAGGETGLDLFRAIMLERRKELAFEASDRWFTLKRLQGVPGIPAEFTNGVNRAGNGYLADGSGAQSAELNLPAGSFKWQLPIARGILNEDPNIEQNTGY